MHWLCKKTTSIEEEANECTELTLIMRVDKSVFIGYFITTRQVIFYMLDLGISFVRNQLNHLIWQKYLKCVVDGTNTSSKSKNFRWLRSIWEDITSTLVAAIGCLLFLHNMFLVLWFFFGPTKTLDDDELGLWYG